MMNGGMKRKIDSLRDLLVGVLPVPTDQIKQITLALIYKFMSDQNQTSERSGWRGFLCRRLCALCLDAPDGPGRFSRSNA